MTHKQNSNHSFIHTQNTQFIDTFQIMAQSTEASSFVLTESTSSTTPCKPKVFNMPRIANFGSAVPPVVLLVLLLSGQRMTTVKPVLNKQFIIQVNSFVEAHRQLRRAEVKCVKSTISIQC